MSIITRYVLKQFASFLLLCTAGGTSLYIAIELFDWIDIFLSHGASAGTIAAYLLYRIPFILFQIIPACMLLATILALGVLSRNNEILAMRTSGVSIYRIVWPLLFVSVLVAALTFLLDEYVVPPTLSRSDYLRKVVIRGQTPTARMIRNRFWLKGREGIFNIACFNPVRKELQGVIILKMRHPFTLWQRIDASSALWNGKEWVFRDVVEREFVAEGRILKSYSPEKILPIEEVPEDFQELESKTDEMPFRQLRRYTRKIQEDGYDATPYVVDLHQKIALPFLNVITIFIAIPFSLKTSRSGGMALGVALSMAIGFLYYVIFALGVSFGHSGVLPPLAAAWAANVLFAALGLYLLLRVETVRG